VNDVEAVFSVAVGDMGSGTARVGVSQPVEKAELVTRVGLTRQDRSLCDLR
jgi:hypothetical protein